MKTVAVIGAVLAAGLLVGRAGAAPMVWDGPSMTFTKADFANPTLAANQDRLTDQVWITRGSSQGLYNAAQEFGYTHDLSPAGTEWAYGVAADWASLSFSDWETWAGGNPPSIVGQDAVLHLVAEDIYLDIRFLSWTGSAGGGGFAYERSTAAVPEPAAGLVVGAGVVGLLWRRGKRKADCRLQIAD